MLAWMCFKQTQRSFSQILLKMMEVSGLISCCQLSFTIRKALRPSAERSVRTLQRGYVLVMDIKLPCWANFLNECLQPPSVSIIMAAAPPPPPVAVKAGTTHPEDGTRGGGGFISRYAVTVRSSQEVHAGTAGMCDITVLWGQRLWASTYRRHVNTAPLLWSVYSHSSATTCRPFSCSWWCKHSCPAWCVEAGRTV